MDSGRSKVALRFGAVLFVPPLMQATSPTHFFKGTEG